MNWRSFILGVFSSLVLAGLLYMAFDAYSRPPAESKDPVELNDTAKEELSFTNLYRGTGDKNTYSQQPEQTFAELVNNESDFKTTWHEMFTGSLPPPLPNINFETQSVLVIMSQQQKTMDYLLTVNEVTIGDEIDVFYELKQPGAGCSPKTRTTRPVHIVAIEKIELTLVNLHETKLSAAPCRIPLN